MNGQLRKREKFKSKWVLADEQARKNGIRCKIYETNGNTYAGEWKDNKRHGKGSYFWKETHLVYEGDWLEGNRTGYGMISHQTEKGDLRKLYAGNWHMNKRHGQGTYFYENGDYYEGEWVNDVREGWGKMMHSNGDSYEGYWSNNLRHGLGMYIFANGDRYEGGWHEDVRHGEGKFFFRKKRRLYEGEWNMNTPIHGEFTDIVGHEDDLDYESVNRNQLDETIMLPKCFLNEKK
ncbi:hypothetical protein SNEBB_009081 [Seison nebaliae]|nr:hypothetical protein SNEBB_009081 [Seison nebaliae]